MPGSQHLTTVCTDQSFRPYLHHEARWLDPEADYELARAYWPAPLSREEWLSFWEDGYQYAAVVEDERIVSLAAAWRYADEASELAAVSTRADRRRQGYAKSVCSFVTKHILTAGLRATCTVMADNQAMRRTAESIGYFSTGASGRAE